MNYTTQTLTIHGKTFDVYRVNNCVNGNPRYVIHYLELGDTYETALAKARALGGKAYRAKWFGGGIVFSSYALEKELRALMKAEA